MFVLALNLLRAYWSPALFSFIKTKFHLKQNYIFAKESLFYFTEFAMADFKGFSLLIHNYFT